MYIRANVRRSLRVKWWNILRSESFISHSFPGLSNDTKNLHENTENRYRQSTFSDPPTDGCVMRVRKTFSLWNLNFWHNLFASVYGYCFTRLMNTWDQRYFSFSFSLFPLICFLSRVNACARAYATSLGPRNDMALIISRAARSFFGHSLQDIPMSILWISTLFSFAHFVLKLSPEIFMNA